MKRGTGMKVAVNMRLPNGAEKTLVYGAKDVAEAYAKAKADHPTWENVRHGNTIPAAFKGRAKSITKHCLCPN